MKKLNIDFLIENSIETITENINSIFNDLIQEVKSYLSLDLTCKNVKWVLNFQNSKFDKDIFNLGVKKRRQNGSPLIELSNLYLDYTPIILLREAYKCFIPYELQRSEVVNVFINQKVEIDLQKLPNIKEWSALFKKSIINYEFLAAEFDRLEKFLKREPTDLFESPFQYFFHFMRQNIQIISENKDHFYDDFFRDYTLKTSKSLYNEEIIETLRVIIEIFYYTKKYSALLRYQDYFKILKKKKVLKTDLSLRKFTVNMAWIKTYSDIAPNYQINWSALNVIPILINLKFNPLLKKKDIDFILKEFPFFVAQRSSRTSFSTEIYGYCVLPTIYSKDLVKFITKLEDFGYIIQSNCFSYNSFRHISNLNYLRDFLIKNNLINFNDPRYERKYEIEFNMDYSTKLHNRSLSMIEWLLIDRIRFFSITGFGFDRKDITLQNLKADYINEILSQRSLIKELKKNLKLINLNEELKSKFLDFLDFNSLKGFFYMKNNLSLMLHAIDLIKDCFDRNPSIQNTMQFQQQLSSNTIEDNLLLNKADFKKIIFSEIIPLYFKSKKFYTEKLNEYQYYFNVLKSCQDLKIFNINVIKAIIIDEFEVEKIFKKKEEKLKKYYESYKDYKITYKLVESLLDDFIKNDLIKPNLISTIFIPFFTNYHLFLILQSRPNIIKRLKEIRSIFPQISIHNCSDISNKMNFICIDVFMPLLEENLRKFFFSIIYNIFKNEIIYFQRYLTSGFVESFSRKDFYDLELKEFFYTPDLFDQFFIYVRNVFGNALNPLPEVQNNMQESFWKKSKDLSDFVELTSSSKKFFDIDLNQITKLVNFHLDLNLHLLKKDKYKKMKEKVFFQKYIKAINFFPAFQFFGLGQYFLYFYPTDLNQIDFRLILANFFQNLKYPLSFDLSNSFLIKFLSPYRNPGVMPYLNWLIKSKKIIREYCIFFVKKIYSLFHLSYNLSSDNWDLDPNRFKIYFQNVLFNPDYKIQTAKLKEFNIGDLNLANYFEPESPEFKALLNIYNWHSIDIKSYLGTKKLATINYLTELLKKGLIYPYLSLKNLDLYEKLYIILPNVKREFNEKLIKIFSFFNYGFIYEVEGEYYIHGFKEKIKFENGMMIKLYLPDCQLDEFTKLFDSIFQYLGIDYYLILNDLIDGKEFFKSIYGNLDFLKSYNPLTNLIWNRTDKIWMNHKLFNEKFEPIYPDLFYGKEKYHSD